MLHGLKPTYLVHAPQLFQLVRASRTRPTVLPLSFVDEQDDEYVFRRDIEPLTQDEVLYRAVIVKRRLDSRFKGLLDIAPIRLEQSQESGKKLSKHLEPNEGNTVENAVLPSASSLGITQELTVENGHLLAEATVEYLHLTVKDFLERQDIWEFIKGASHVEFSANVSPCRSHLL
jgi:hypothetical protein